LFVSYNYSVPIQAKIGYCEMWSLPEMNNSITVYMTIFFAVPPYLSHINDATLISAVDPVVLNSITSGNM